MRRLLIHGLLTTGLVSLPPALHGQATPPSTCTDDIGKSMEFLKGQWEGPSYSVVGADTTLDATMRVSSRPLFGLCALEERWQAVQSGKALFTASVVRAYDGPTKRWQVYYVDDQLNSQIWEGRWESGQWRFFRTRLDRGGPIIVRLTWRRTEGGYEQLIERSRDDGKSWTLGGFVSYRPSGR